MRDKFTVLTNGVGPIVEVSETYHAEIGASKRGLLKILLLEEQLDLLVENYFEYEEELLRLTLRNAVFPGNRDWSTLMDDLSFANRKFANLLSAARLYADQSCHVVSSIFGKRSTQLLRLKQMRSKEYDDSPSYRIMEALRNVVQHQMLPTSVINYPATWRRGKSEGEAENGEGSEPQTRSSLHHSIQILVDVKELEEEGDVKPIVIQDLRKMGERVNITGLLRRYVESYCRTHEEIHGLIKEERLKWEQTVDELIERTKSEIRPDLAAVDIIVSGLDAAPGLDIKTAARIYIDSQIVKRTKALMRKHVALKSLSHRYVSSECG